MSKIAAVVIFLFGFSATMWAQSGNSTISGTVKDATSAAVPDAKSRLSIWIQAFNSIR